MARAGEPVGGEVVGGKASGYAVGDMALLLGVGCEGELVPDGFFDCGKEVNDKVAGTHYTSPDAQQQHGTCIWTVTPPQGHDLKG